MNHYIAYRFYFLQVFLFYVWFVVRFVTPLIYTLRLAPNLEVPLLKKE